MDTTTQSTESVTRFWDEQIVPALVDYIRIPNVSSDYDPDWQAHGHMQRAARLIEAWCRQNAVEGMLVEVVQLEGRGPLIVMEIPATGPSTDTVLMYGHMDKQPEMEGWADGLGPWTPVIRGDRLYGRGGADDGYAAFASVAAIRLLREQGRPHPRCLVMIESGEESGSPDLPAYLDLLRERLGRVTLIVCLDSGCGDYDRMWCTTSLRGLVGGDLTVRILEEGVHSGDASGIVPSSFRILRQLLARLEDADTGEVLVRECHVTVPPARLEQAAAVAEVMGTSVWDKFPFVAGAEPVTRDLTELILNRTWRPTLCITGGDGLPAAANAGNVLRPYTTLKVSMRVPPRCDSKAAAERVKQILETNPPYGARVTFKSEHADGWDAPPLAAWLDKAIAASSRAHFGHEAVYMGEGGSIPFMGLLGERYPEAQFLITGVLGPNSNAHGPNEFLDLPTARKITACVSDVLAAHCARV